MCQSGAYSVPANVSQDNILNHILHIFPDILCALLACRPTYMWARSKWCSRHPWNITMLWACQPTYIVPRSKHCSQQPWNITSPQACQQTYMWACSKEVIQGSHTLICISNTHSYLQGDYYIAYYIILIIGTNHTLYHKLIHCLYTIPINQKVTMRYVLNMGIPTRRYLISPY